MNASSRFLLRSLLLSSFILVSTAARAQTPPEKSTLVHARFHCLSIAETGFPELSFLNGRAEIPLDIPRDFLSPAYDYRGPGRLVILRKTPPPPPGAAPDPSGEGLPPDRAPALAVDLPPGGGEFLLLFGRGADGQPRAIPIAYSTTDVPLGSYLVWNLSARPLGLQLENSRTLIAPGRREIVKLADGENTYMPLKVFDEAHGLVFGSRHLHRPQTRQLVFLADAPDRPDRVTLRMITQTVFPPKPAEPPALAALPSRR